MKSSKAFEFTFASRAVALVTDLIILGIVWAFFGLRVAFPAFVGALVGLYFSEELLTGFMIGYHKFRLALLDFRVDQVECKRCTYGGPSKW